MRILTFLALFCVALCACEEPREPWCVNNKLNEHNFESCRLQVESYLDKLESYLQCVSKSVNEKSKKVTDRFNCRASGETNCGK